MNKLDHKIKYYAFGNKYYEKYSLNGKLHNEKGPANIWYDSIGNKWHEEYYLNDELHNNKWTCTYLLL